MTKRQQVIADAFEILQTLNKWVYNNAPQVSFSALLFEDDRTLGEHISQVVCDARDVLASNLLKKSHQKAPH